MVLFKTILDWHVEASQTPQNSFIRQVYSIKTTSDETLRNVYRILHSYLHAQKPDRHRLLLHQKSLSGLHLRHYPELLLESVLASQGTSVTAFLQLGQVTPQEARSGSKTATQYPSKRTVQRRQRPASFTHPVTLQQCVVGAFYAMGQWNLSPGGSCWHLCLKTLGRTRPAWLVKVLRVSEERKNY